MDIDVADIDLKPSSNRLPGALDPCLLDIAINQDVEMWISVFLQFDHGDVFRGFAEFPAQIDAEFIECLAEICRSSLVVPQRKMSACRDAGLVEM
jgi:hypothetical protein